jgi:4-methylaminobutanoate oxidase (formaldehyde-forming)
VENEIAAARTGLAVADVSAFAKIRLLGRGVPELTQALVGDGPATKPLGVARLKTAGRGWACRLTVDQLLLLPLATSPADHQVLLAKAVGFPDVIQRDVTSAYAGFGLIGPLREKLLCRLTRLDMSETALPVATCAETSLAGVHALLIPWSELSLPGMWIYVSWDVAEYVWETLLESGRSLAITPIGVDSLQFLLSPARDEPPL